MIFFDIECQHMDERRTMNDEYIAAGDDSRPVNSDFATKHFTGFPQRAALWPAPTATSVMSRRPASRILKKSLTIPLHSSILNELSGQGPDAAGSLNLKKVQINP